MQRSLHSLLEKQHVQRLLEKQHVYFIRSSFHRVKSIDNTVITYGSFFHILRGTVFRCIRPPLFRGLGARDVCEVSFNSSTVVA